jgi:hypothetical protein
MDLRKGLVFGLLALSLGGCRFKGGESYLSATTPTPQPTWGGDRYAAAGIADSTGGLQPGTPYMRGAQPTSTERTDPLFNRPQKGSGQRIGEAGNAALPGHGRTNAPSFQEGPQADHTGGY